MLLQVVAKPQELKHRHWARRVAAALCVGAFIATSSAVAGERNIEGIGKAPVNRLGTGKDLDLGNRYIGNDDQPFGKGIFEGDIGARIDALRDAARDRPDKSPALRTQPGNTIRLGDPASRGLGLRDSSTKTFDSGNDGGARLLREDLPLGGNSDLRGLDDLGGNDAELRGLLGTGNLFGTDSEPSESASGVGAATTMSTTGTPMSTQALDSDKPMSVQTLSGAGKTGGGARESGRSTSGIDVDIRAISTATYMRHEVLALDLRSADMSRARQLGFQLDDSVLSQTASGIIRLTAPVGMDALEALALLRKQLPGCQFHLNRIYHSYRLATTTGPESGERTAPAESGLATKCLADRCYGRSLIHWSDKFASCTRGIRVGVIDTEADLRHPTFAGQKINHARFLPTGMQPSTNWHGTGVLALLAGRPDSGTPGLIPEASFFLASIFFADEAGEAVTDTVSLLRALQWMTASGVKVINMSFAGPRDELVQARIRAMRAKGFVFTAAAGNEGPAARPTYPAAYPEVVAVTAVSKDMRVFPSAVRGPHIDVAAPGVDIWTAIPGAREGYKTGTSFAAPFATAVLALQQPELFQASENELLEKLHTVALGGQGRNPIYGRGLLQAPGECPTPTETASGWAPVSASTRK